MPASLQTVQADFQAVINFEWKLSLQYHLCSSQLRGWGLKNVPDQVAKFGEQSKRMIETLLTRARFMGGDPQYTPTIASETYDTVTEGFQDLVQLEGQMCDLYAKLCTDCWELGGADALNNFHLAQHLIKWHQTGGNGFDGHLIWLNQQLNQIKMSGEVAWKTELWQHDGIAGEA